MWKLRICYPGRRVFSVWWCGDRADVDAEVKGSAAAVLRNWEEIKTAEKATKRLGQAHSRLDAAPRALPALAEAAKLGAEARKCGFDWQQWRDLLPKLAEETAELETEAASSDPLRKPAIEAELGDLLFTAVNLGRHLGVDAEMALRGCNRRFRERFRRMECATGKPLEELSPAELESLWQDAKRALDKDEAAAGAAASDASKPGAAR